MKIKNLAFFGIMAAILGVNGAARADSTTIIASQAYVDAKDALKQDKDNRVQTSQADYEAISGLDDTRRKADYPSMYTLKQAIDGINTELNNIDVSGDISTAIGDLDGDITGDTGVVKTISQTDGVVTATRNTVDTADITDSAVTSGKIADGTIADADVSTSAAITTNKMGAITGYQIASNDADVAATDTLNVALGKLAKRSTLNQNEIAALKNKIELAGNPEFLDAYNAWIRAGRKYSGTEWDTLQARMNAEGFTDVDNVVADYQISHQDLIPRNRNIQKGVLYMEGTGIENLTVSADPSAEKSWTTYGGRNNNIKALETAKAMDQYVPTMAAVESRVLAAIETASSGSNTAINALDSSQAADSGYVLTGITQEDGTLTAKAQTQISNSHVASDAAITTNKIGAITGYEIASSDADVAATDTLNEAIGKLAKRSGDNKTAITTLNGNDTTAGSVAKSIKDKIETLDSTSMTANGQPVVTVNQTDGVVTAAQGTITYAAGLDSKLSNVNATGDSARAMEGCTLKSPCTLTMIWSDGKPVYEWTNMDTEDTSATL